LFNDALCPVGESCPRQSSSSIHPKRTSLILGLKGELGFVIFFSILSKLTVR
jgi:hypothetical protein